MILASLGSSVVSERLRRGELLLDLGPIILRIEADSDWFSNALQILYANSRSPEVTEEVADLTLQLRPAASGVFLWLVDGRPAGKPNPFTEPMAMAEFEWAIHFGLATAFSPAIAFHGSVAVREDGHAVAMIGKSGSGKSTLVGGLVAAGWSLCADEYLIVNPDGRIIPMPGLITLKGNAIELMRARGGDLTFGPSGVHPERGIVMHAAAQRTSAQSDKIILRSLVFPSFVSGQSVSLDPLAPQNVFARLVEQSHNRHVLDRHGFLLLAQLARIPASALWFSDLDEGISAVRSTLAEVP